MDPGGILTLTVENDKNGNILILLQAQQPPATKAIVNPKEHVVEVNKKDLIQVAKEHPEAAATVFGGLCNVAAALLSKLSWALIE